MRSRGDMLTDAELAEVFRTFAESAPVQIMLVDRRHTMCHLNRFEHGFTAEQVIGRPVAEFIPEPYRERVVRAVEHALTEGKFTEYETMVNTPDGPAHYRTRVGPVRMGGEIPYASLVSFDITTEHRVREAAARELAVLTALERVNRAILAAPTTPAVLDGVLAEMLDIFDADRAFLVYPCDPTASHLGVVHEKVRPGFRSAMGMHVPMDAVLADVFERVLAQPGTVVRYDPESNPLPADAPVVETFQVRSMLATAVRPEHDRPWCLGIHHCREARVYDAEVPILAAVSSRISDAIHTLLVQRALRESEERFRVLVEHAPDAIVIFDAESGGFVEVNQRAIELFGMSREELLCRSPLDVSTPTQPDGSDSATRVRELIDEALRGGKPVVEWTHRNAAGEPLECEVRLVRLPHEERRWVRGSVVHIADRKRAERENERLSAQLAQAQKMQAIGQLTGGVAHDFNNLLTVIGGSLAMIELHAGDEQSVRHFGELATEACNRGAQLTQRLLAFSRLQPLRPRSLDLAELVRGMEGLLGRTLGETIRVQLHLAHDLWPCEVDPAQLENAILNLSINARDAMPRGGSLTIEARNAALDASAAPSGEEVSPGDYVLLAVHDDGEGMSPEVLDKAFEPFFTTKEVGKGSGLGLSMVYGFIKQSRGHVRIRSERGGGTTVELYLPRGGEVPAAAKTPPPGAFEPVGRGERVLLVEDDERLRGVIFELLGHLGFRVVAAEHGPEALGLLEGASDIALLVSDMVLPGGMNGLEVARRAQALRPGLPVLFMSGYTEDTVVHEGRLDAGVRLLEKPFTTAALAAAVREALSAGRRS